MKNIWIILGATLFLSAILIGTIIVFLFIKKKRKILEIIAQIFLIGIVIFCLSLTGPLWNDLEKQQTTQIVATYTKFENRGEFIGSRHLIFEYDGKELILESPKIARQQTKMEVGKRYKIEYFNNSKVVKTFELVE